MQKAAAGGAPRSLSEWEQDIQMMLAIDVHLGVIRKCDFPPGKNFSAKKNRENR
jgi:small subunit ribosomal protein SAe